MPLLVSTVFSPLLQTTHARAVLLCVRLNAPLPRHSCYSHFQMMQDRDELPKNETFAKHFAKDLQEIHDFKCLPPSTSSNSNTDKETALSSSLCRHGAWEISNTVHRGFYAQQLQRFFRQGYRLGHDLLVFPYERFKTDPALVFDEIMDFLSVPRHTYPVHQLNQTILPVEPRRRRDDDDAAPSPETRKLVHEFYKPYNEQLAVLLGEEWRGIWD
jgi:Sulfotransferase domain